MKEWIADAPPRLKARLAGGVYLLMIVTGGLAKFFSKGLVVAGDAAASAHNIVAHAPAFRANFTGDLLVVVWYVVVTALLYDLFKPVDRTVSLLAAFFSLVGCATQAFASLFYAAPLTILGSGPHAAVFSAAQLQALASLSLDVYRQAYGISLVFFGFYLLLIGYLVFQSTFMPRLLGLLVMVSGLGWLTFLWPPLARALFPRVILILGIGEGLLILWLLAFGVNAERWQQRAAPKL